MITFEGEEVLIGTAFDINDQKVAQEELRESEEKMRGVFRSMADMVFVYDKDGNFIFYHAQDSDKLYQTPDVFLGKHYTEVLPPYLHEKMSIAFETNKKYEPANIEYFLEFDGTIMYFSATMSPIFKDGVYNGSVGVVRDITFQKNAEIDLRESEEKYRNSVERAGDGIIMIQNGIMTYANPALTELTGYSSEEITDKPFSQFLSEKEREKVIDRYRRRMAGEEVESFYESEIIAKEGHTINVEFSIGVFELKGIQTELVFIHDITERKESDEKIRRALKEKETLLQELYHRTKNNMNNIISMLWLYKSRCKIKEMTTIMTDLESRIHTMALVHELMCQSEDLSSINLAEYIRNLSIQIKGIYGDKDANVSIDLDLDDVNMLLDTSIPCGLVIGELISNSMKYAFPNGEIGTIKISLKQDTDNQIKIIVSDNGVGLPEGFDIEDSDTLGLMLMKNIVEDQLVGKLVHENKDGLKWTITFKKDQYKKRL